MQELFENSSIINSNKKESLNIEPKSKEAFSDDFSEEKKSLNDYDNFSFYFSNKENSDNDIYSN